MTYKTQLQEAISFIQNNKFDPKKFVSAVVADNPMYFIQIMKSMTQKDISYVEVNEKKSEKYDVYLKSSGSDKIGCIRTIRGLTSCSLACSKDIVDIVDNAPEIIASYLSAAVVEQMKTRFANECPDAELMIEIHP